MCKLNGIGDEQHPSLTPITPFALKGKRYDFFLVINKNIEHGKTNTDTNTYTEHAHYLWEH